MFVYSVAEFFITTWNVAFDNLYVYTHLTDCVMLGILGLLGY